MRKESWRNNSQKSIQYEAERTDKEMAITKLKMMVASTIFGFEDQLKQTCNTWK
jgi:hypothetical protein